MQFNVYLSIYTQYLRHQFRQQIVSFNDLTFSFDQKARDRKGTRTQRSRKLHSTYKIIELDGKQSFHLQDILKFPDLKPIAP